MGVFRSEIFLEKWDTENSGGGTPAYLYSVLCNAVSPRLVGIWAGGRKSRVFRSLVFEVALFCTRYSRLQPVFLKHLLNIYGHRAPL
jgi:hypothetical protein